MAGTQPVEQHPETAPDPDEDDLSDLDDMLDDFSSANLGDTKPAAPAPLASRAPPGPGRPTAEAPPVEDEAEFAKQLQAGMAELLGEMGSDPEMQKEFEQMMQQLGAAAATDGTPIGPADVPVPAKSGAQSGPSKKGAEDSFQDTIRRTMERMQNSGETASAAAAASSEDDMLAQMLKEMENGGFPGMDGEGNEEDFNKMLLGMMEQLTNKEILYDPMKELQDKFPDWMRKNKDTVSKPDLVRYEEQHSLVSAIVGRFERKGYSDSNQEDRDFIVDKMQKMQAAGSPPPDLVGDMSSAQEALAGMDSGCPQQ